MSRLDEIEFATNPEPRCPCVLLLDTSGSMSGPRINALNQGICVFKESLSADPLAAKRVEVAIITFESRAALIQDFVTVDQFNPPVLDTGGSTAMGAAVVLALDHLTQRKAKYKSSGISYYRPWVFLITDGAPTDSIDEARRRIAEGETKSGFAFFAVGVEDADMNTLGTLSSRAPLKLNGLNFSEMFVWLSASMSRVSQSKVDEQVALPPPGWGAV
jgi:uncharacterized protein YegL